MIFAISDVLYTDQTDNCFKYIYTIENFSLRPEKIGEKIISPIFVVGSKERSEWCLFVCPNGNEEESKEYVSVYLALLKPNKAKVKFCLSILNDKEEKNNIRIVDNIIDLNKRDKSNGLLVNDKLTILCEAEIFELESENHENSVANALFDFGRTIFNILTHKYTTHKNSQL
uniref:Speckle-type POZ protein-like (inferred by orthology to a human protein) n=1 Tax=Strongyloides venezuelensis TaxID=75913 RepID=A0A0K0F3J9_STRVS